MERAASNATACPGKAPDTSIEIFDKGSNISSKYLCCIKICENHAQNMCTLPSFLPSKCSLDLLGDLEVI